MKKIAVLAGDGIGPEVMKEAIKVLDAVQKKNSTWSWNLFFRMWAGLPSTVTERHSPMKR